MGVRRCLARSLTSLALMRTPKSANGPRSNSFRPDSPSTTNFPRGRKTQPSPSPHRTWSVPDSSSPPQLNLHSDSFCTCADSLLAAPGMRGEIFTDRIGIIPEYHTGGADEFHGVARQRIVFPVSKGDNIFMEFIQKRKDIQRLGVLLNGIQVLV